MTTAVNKSKVAFSIDKILQTQSSHNSLTDQQDQVAAVPAEGDYHHNAESRTSQVPHQELLLNNIYSHSLALQKMFGLQNAFNMCFSCYDRFNVPVDVRGYESNFALHYRLLPGMHSQELGTKRKGGQIRFTSFQTKHLENRFTISKYLPPDERKHLASQLKLSDRQVKTWFQNRRAKWRRSYQSKCSSSTSESCPPETKYTDVP